MPVIERPTVVSHSVTAIGPREAYLDVQHVQHYPSQFEIAEVPYSTSKRVLDVALSVGILTLTAPILLAAAAAVKLTSRGPVLFKQTRVGLAGREFTCYKLRSM